MFDLLKKLTGSGPSVDLKALAEAGAMIVDVRTPAEYKSGHLKGSVNIPLDSIGAQMDRIKKSNKVVITCCRSGARSGAAASQLRNAGIEAHNGGPWDSLARVLKG